MHTVIRILLEQGEEGQVNYLPGTLQGHHAAPGHEEAGCACRATMNATTPQSANDYMCRYDMLPCVPTFLCDNRRQAYEDDRDRYDRKVSVAWDAATGLPREIPCYYEYDDFQDDEVAQLATAPSEEVCGGVRAGSKDVHFRYAPFEMRASTLNPHTDEYEGLYLGFGPNAVFKLPH